MTDFLKNLEQELASYRAKFKESSETLGDLAKIQSDFEGLSQKYKQIQVEHQKLSEFVQESRAVATDLQKQSKDAIKQIELVGEHFQEEFTNSQQEIVENFTQFQKELNQQFKKSEYELRQLSIEIKEESKNALEQVTHSNEASQQEITALKHEILENFTQFQKELNYNFENLNNESHQKIVDIQSDIRTESKRYQEELGAKVEEHVANLASSQQKLQQSLSRLESELNNTNASINGVKQSVAQQLEHIPNRFAIVEENQARINQKILFIGVGSLLAILLAFVSLFMPQRNNTPSPQSQSSQLINPNS
ncbi:chromosome partition protein Smc [Calothrix sp. NIES-4071]|nr:chromosome partition protein Smc [Calothrix sp. NIES-4071]BAZ56808.1 chromosome partition protein Smc [Calothrix sp. NIES-4105]